MLLIELEGIVVFLQICDAKVQFTTRSFFSYEGKRKTLSFVIYIIINSNGSHYHTVSKSTDHVQFTRALFFQGAYNAE